mmetsp:Transcript_7092/g.6943  ORF Transcript_7092/g.6943 Transcript_7092/m.6943 type:complete len:227 (-) Transcript_7092:43-723(-)|eukprot:CAMPEP_0202948834 /NCGR_PEP_ID=MMETSP1395-20130829/14681_1 /ASSEMBLY_ACC=CAM_ASM_000871 /TAXON_ID=5961 /ORGANISM="Blepharisma japonicum, Strain Stock R1072" /LENGTH=226 /DNA_ID=CAMNT_0049651285 /DNA_START=12 /DNA_END=692 /DNA_ORIENTATION=+
MDDFLKDLDKATRVKNQLNIDLAERDRKLLNGEVTSRLDAKLRGGLQELAVDIDGLIRMIEAYKQEPSRYKLNTSEIDKRKAQVAELERELAKIDEKTRQGTKIVQAGVGVNFKRDGSSETQDTRNLSNKDLRSAQSQMIKNQSALEDAIVGTSENLVVAAKNIGDELDVHAQLLDDVDKNVDHNQLKINNSTARMKELIIKSADGFMFCCIVILIALLIVILVAL